MARPARRVLRSALMLLARLFTTAPTPPSPRTRRTRPGVPVALRSPLAFVSYYVRLRPWRFGGLIGAVALAALCALGAQFGLKLLVDALSGPRGGMAVETALATFLGLVAVETLLWRVGGWIGCQVTIATGVDIRADVLDHLTGQSMSFFQNTRAGALAHRVTALAGAFGALCGRLVWDVTPPVVGFLGALVLLRRIDNWLAAGVAALCLGTTAALIALGRRGAALHRAHAAQSSRVGGELMDVLVNIWPVKAFGARARERARMVGEFRAEAAAHAEGWLFSERLRILNDLALLATVAGTLLWVLHLWGAGGVTAGDVVLVVTLTFRLLHGSRDLAVALISASESYANVGETLSVLAGEHALADAPDARRLVRRDGAVRFEGVRFGYGRDRAILRDLTFEVPPGQKLGLVGPSGAGKSTVLSLLQRLHDPQSGRILVDGQDIATLLQDSVRAALAVVPQEVTLFHRSIGENIRFGRPEASDQEVRDAARAALCEDFIDALPRGYDTLVGDRGSKLSGGQRQRLGVARALLKNAPIVLLDEATSALDAESEQEVQRALDRLMQGRTVIAVAHRLSTVAGFDRIVVMQAGEVVEDGAPLELRARRGAFERMWRLQSEGLDAPRAQAALAG